MFTLVTFLINEPEIPKFRIEEIQFSLIQNRLNPHIQNINVLCCPKFNQSGEMCKFLEENGINYCVMEELSLFRDLVSFCQTELVDKKVILAYPDVFFPIGSGIGTLNTVNLKNNILGLTPYHLSTGKYIDNLYTGIIRPYQNKKIKLHGLDGRSIACWIFASPMKLEKVKLNLEIMDSCNKFDSLVASCITRQFSNYLPISNPSLEIVSIRVNQKWHPKQEFKIDYKGQTYNKTAFRKLLREEDHGPLQVFPVTVKEIGNKVIDSSDCLGQYLIEFQTGHHNGEKVVKMPVDQIKKGVAFNLKAELAKIREHAYPREKTNNVSQLSSRLLHPEKVSSTFMVAQQRGRLMSK